MRVAKVHSIVACSTVTQYDHLDLRSPCKVVMGVLFVL